MVHYTKVVRGLKSYAEQELIGKMTGSFRGWLAGAAVELVGMRAEQYFRQLAENPMVKASGLISGENVDVDAALSLLRTQAQKSPATLELGWLGSWTFNASDIDVLARHIQGA